MINHLCRQAYEIAKNKGWYDEGHPNDAERIALMHSELSEALEAMRKPDLKDKHLPELNPVVVELADVCIRIFDYCGANGFDLEEAIFAKMQVNRNRPHKHGGKKF